MTYIEKIGGEDFERFVLGSEMPVLVEFGTPLCPACRSARPMLEGLARDFVGRVKVVEVDVESEPELGRLFRIRAVPTFAFFKDGAVSGGVVGAPPARELRRAMEELAGSCTPKG